MVRPVRARTHPPAVAMPRRLVPMMAASSKMPVRQQDFGFELKWDGIRALGYCRGGKLELESRNLRDITSRYPELVDLGKDLAHHQAVLDGEIIAVDEQGLPSFQLLQQRMGLLDPQVVRRRQGRVPIVYVLFDLLYLDGELLLPLPYTQRRQRLEELKLAGPCWQTPPYIPGHGEELLALARQRHLEGIIAKELVSPYQPGQRSGAWRKIKLIHSQEFVIGGWMQGQGAFAGELGSVLLGYYDQTPQQAPRQDQPPKLIYAGSAGTGLTHSQRAQLKKKLQGLAQTQSPFANVSRRDAHFVRPELVAQVEFRQWTESGTLRQPALKGLREDKDPRQVVRER